MRLSLKAKVLSLAILPVLMFGLVISATTVFMLHQQADREVSDTRERLLSEAKSTLQNYVAIAMTAIKPLYEASAPGDETARATAIKLLSAVSYGKDGYLFGYDSQVIRIFRSTNPDGLGKSFNDVRDPNGVYLNRELVAVGKAGTHYVMYSSALPGKTEPVPKIGYTEYLPKWDLVVGSAVNLDGIDAQVAVVRQNVEARLQEMLYSILGITLLVLVVISVAGMLLTGTLLRPLRLMKDNLDDIAAGEGDLTRRLAVTSNDELGELATSFNRFVDKIHGMVRQVTEMTGQLNGLVSEVSSQAQRSESAMERQRHETDQVATAINEMSAAAQEVAKSAQGASVAAQQTDEQGRTAKRVVDGSIRQIHALVDDIRKSGTSLDSLQQDVSSIVSVLGVIRSIAEQTNLLALNAAIEAARAGEQGRGFAVVADEVRLLAQRTQKSTAEIQAMIERLQRHSDAAVKVIGDSSRSSQLTIEQANQAGQSLSSISQALRNLNGLNASIASATLQQSHVVDDINQNVTQAAQLSQSTALAAEQSTTASQHLRRLSEQLNDLLKQFRV